MGKSFRHTMIVGNQKNRSEKAAKRSIHHRERGLVRSKLHALLEKPEAHTAVCDRREVSSKALMPKAGKRFISPAALDERILSLMRANPDNAKIGDRFLHRMLAK